MEDARLRQRHRFSTPLRAVQTSRAIPSLPSEARLAQGPPKSSSIRLSQGRPLASSKLGAAAAQAVLDKVCEVAVPLKMV